MAKNSKFGSAFAAARKAGKKEFTYGGKKYNTRTKEDGKAKKETPKPTPRPSRPTDTDTRKEAIASNRAAKSTSAGKARSDAASEKKSMKTAAAKSEAPKKAKTVREAINNTFVKKKYTLR